MNSITNNYLSIESTDTWDTNFFKKFVSFKNNHYKSDKKYLKESITDAQLVFRDHQPCEFKAFLIKHKEAFVARFSIAIYPHREEIFIGHFEAINCKVVMENIINIAKDHAKQLNKTSIVGPIDLNIFLSYRLKEVGAKKSFFVDPYHKEYYPELFKKSGFMITESWSTKLLDKKLTSIKKILSLKNKNKSKSKKEKGFKVRKISLKNWEKELEIIYHLFMESYKELSYYEPIKFDLFKAKFNDFKYLLNPNFAYILEYKGAPCAFFINFFDPSTHLCRLQNRNSKLLKAYDVLRLKVNRKNLLYVYMGKVDLEGVNTKGVQSYFAKHLIPQSFFAFTNVYVCLVNNTSPIHKAYNFLSNTQATYHLYKYKI